MNKGLKIRIYNLNYFSKKYYLLKKKFFPNFFNVIFYDYINGGMSKSLNLLN